MTTCSLNTDWPLAWQLFPKVTSQSIHITLYSTPPLYVWARVGLPALVCLTFWLMSCSYSTSHSYPIFSLSPWKDKLLLYMTCDLLYLVAFQIKLKVVFFTFWWFPDNILIQIYLFNDIYIHTNTYKYIHCNVIQLHCIHISVNLNYMRGSRRKQ